MGFTALGGLTAVLVSVEPVPEAWEAGGTGMLISLLILAATILGGIGQPVGAILGGFVVAFSEVMVTYAYKKFLAYLGPSGWAPDGLVQLLSTDYKFAVSFIILVAVLLVRPTGIIRGKVIV